jgi:glycosyltransferase involved in cell wall biosynthesis
VRGEEAVTEKNVAKFVAVNWRDLRNPDAGGAEVHLHEILTRLAAEGHDVTYFVSNFEGGAEEETYDGIRVVRTGRWYNANFAVTRRVRAYLRDHPCDLVIEDINKIPFLVPLAARAKVIAVVPHLFGATVYRETNPLFASYVYLWERLIPLVYRRCRFVVISESTKTDLVGRGIPADRIDVVLCGLDHATYRVIEGVEREAVPTIVHFGRVRKYKSIDIVIRAFARVRESLPAARLLIIGDGPERENLARLARRLGLAASVEFTGVVSTPELVGILNRAHLFVNASPKEGWGLTVIEANACGLPVVASRRPGLQDSVRDAVTGYLVDYGDVEGFARRSLELLSEPAKWRRMSEAGLEWARSLTWERTGREMRDIFMGEIASVRRRVDR